MSSVFYCSLYTSHLKGLTFPLRRFYKQWRLGKKKSNSFHVRLRSPDGISVYRDLLVVILHTSIKVNKLAVKPRLDIYMGFLPLYCAEREDRGHLLKAPLIYRSSSDFNEYIFSLIC